ncbi:MAG: SUMF1/EgtB/PvdO family nonheme iron enzyme [Desulfuromonadales bacterium]
MSYSYAGTRLNYAEYTMAHNFVDGIKSSNREAGERVSMAISRQTRDVIASNEALNAENIRATEIAAGQISDAMSQGFGELSGVMSDGFSRISYDIQAVSAGIDELNATFHWGFSQMLSTMGRMNDSLQDLIRIAKTPAQTAAYEQYEIARDAFRQGLYQECMESLNIGINGNQASTGYKLEWRFHQMKGSVLLGFVGCDAAMIDLPLAEESFLLAARYAKADYPDHAGKAFLSAGWAAYCQGKMNVALTHTEQAIAINPNLGEALFQAAKVKMALGEVDAALPVLARAIDQDRFYALKAAGDGDFQRYDDKLRGYLDAMRKEKYRQAVPKVRGALEDVQRILKRSPDGKGNKAIEKLESFLARGENWPLMDMLAVVQGLDAVIAEAKRLPIAVIIEAPRTEEETYQEQESYQEEVVIKQAGWFSKAVTEMQTRTRTVTRKRTVNKATTVRIDLCAIPAGTFMMGDSSHSPVHQVTISRDFYLGKYPVTQAQWEAVMGRNPSKFKGADRPVEQVSHDDCQEFVKRLNATGKGTFRLPTEAEWEYACRAGSTSTYCFGDSDAQLGDYAWYSANSGSQTQPVGRKKANFWGLHDMHGNVWEWCQDWHGDYPSEAVTDPQGPSSGSGRVLRGGCWLFDASLATSAFRYESTPDIRYDFLGFRVVCLSVR